jgi:hypothetical protein
MSHVSECIQLYRHDLFVTNDEYGRLIQDALERDEAEAFAAEVPEPEPFTLDAAAVGEAILRNAGRSNGKPAPEPEPAGDVARLVREHVEQLVSTVADPPSYVARLVLEQFEQLVSTVETNGEAIALLGTADKLRRETVEALTAAVEHLTQRMNLRAEECRALNRRIDNLAAHVGRIAERLA